MIEMCKNGLEEVEKEGGTVVCIVQECAEMPAYSGGLRRRFNVPVYDTITAIQFVQMGRDVGQYSAYMM
jgi:Asp/Glu/hydantoin racemase